MLKLGQLSGKCADINGLLVGLARRERASRRVMSMASVLPNPVCFPRLDATATSPKRNIAAPKFFLEG